MKSLFLTREFPPEIYGGAGVHVDYLSRALSQLCEVEVRCWGDRDPTPHNSIKLSGHSVDTSHYRAPKAIHNSLQAFQYAIDWNAAGIDADVVHVHTWYAHLGGILAKLHYGTPLVLTSHSLEPLRPWKREQLGGGYDASLWVERTAVEMADAVIAVSEGSRRDILDLYDIDPAKIHVIYNGIDTEEYKPSFDTISLQRHGVDLTQPYVLFVGRITRQKGIIHLVNAIEFMDPGYQIVLCAGAPDTPEIAAEMRDAVHLAQRDREGIIWIQEMLPTHEKIALYSGAQVFVCPSIYEPFGIINLEAMACETAVVASAVGGMTEVVVDGTTGYLVPLLQQKESPFEALHPNEFAHDLAQRINKLMDDPALCQQLGQAGRRRAIEKFSWTAIAQQTATLYHSLLPPP
jgi:alpha-maltose-1-phosphate synthase